MQVSNVCITKEEIVNRLLKKNLISCDSLGCDFLVHDSVQLVDVDVDWGHGDGAATPLHQGL
jgi:hypothetical protein